MLTAQTIKNHHSDIFTFLHGDLESAAANCHVPEQAQRHSLVYVSDAAQLAEARRHKPAILIVHAKMADRLCQRAGRGQLLLLGQEHFHGHGSSAEILRPQSATASRNGASAIRPRWCIRDAIIGEGVFLGPYCVIGARRQHRRRLHDRRSRGRRERRQDRRAHACCIHMFSWAPAASSARTARSIRIPASAATASATRWIADGRPRKISHLGNVNIGDGVEIGSNCAIDRATLTSTYIRSGTKLDNICHIAHNCDLGENGFFTAGFMMGGSTKIGRQFVTGGNSVVTAHVTLGDNVVLSGTILGHQRCARCRRLRRLSAAAAEGGDEDRRQHRASQRDSPESQSRHEASASSRQDPQDDSPGDLTCSQRSTPSPAPLAALIVAMLCFQLGADAGQGIVPDRGRRRYGGAALGACRAHVVGRVAPWRMRLRPRARCA